MPPEAFYDGLGSVTTEELLEMLNDPHGWTVAERERAWREGRTAYRSPEDEWAAIDLRNAIDNAADAITEALRIPKLAEWLGRRLSVVLFLLAVASPVSGQTPPGEDFFEVVEVCKVSTVGEILCDEIPEALVCIVRARVAFCNPGSWEIESRPFALPELSGLCVEPWPCTYFSYPRPILFDSGRMSILR